MIQFVPEPHGREALDAFLRRLLVADWKAPEGPLRLSADLSLADLAEADFFLNAGLFLAALMGSQRVVQAGEPAAASRRQRVTLLPEGENEEISCESPWSSEMGEPMRPIPACPARHAQTNRALSSTAPADLSSGKRFLVKIEVDR